MSEPAAEGGQIEERREDEEPEAVAAEEAARNALFVVTERPQGDAHAVEGGDEPDEARGDQDAPEDLADDGVGDRGEREQEEEEEACRPGHRRPRLLGADEGGVALRVVERAEEVHRAEGGDADAQGAERDPHGQVAVVRHQEEREHRAERRGDAAAQDAQGIAFAEQRHGDLRRGSIELELTHVGPQRRGEFG